MTIHPPTRLALTLVALLVAGGVAHGQARPATSSRLEVRPLDVTRPVQAQQLVIATFYDGNNTPRSGHRIEWTLEGAGQIIAVDEGRWFGSGSKVESRYAVTKTNFQERRYSRGTSDPNDDFMIRQGQTWCVISSAVEGDTYLTAYAPDVEGWDRKKVVVTTHWIDADWRLPPPAIARAGTQHLFTVQMTRRSNHQPLVGYRVRFHILDGPPALLLPSRGQEDTVVSDATGDASVTLVQTQPGIGVNRIGIEVIRPPGPEAPTGTGIVVATGETRLDWQGPQLKLSGAAPPVVPLNGEATVTLSVDNPGQVAAQEMTLRDTVPDGLQFVRSDPPAARDGNQLIWTLPALPGGKAHTIQAVFRGTKPGAVSSTATVVTRDGLHDEAKTATQVTVPQLTVKLTGPDTAIVAVPIRYDILVSNTGTGAAANVELMADFDGALVHDSKANPLRLPVGLLQPGEGRTVPLTLTARQKGKMQTRVTAAGEGGLTARGEHAVQVQHAALHVELKGPANRYQNRPADWMLHVVNEGEIVLANVVVRDLLPPELAFVAASDGGRLINNEVVWPAGTLAPGEGHDFTVKTTCARLTPRALNMVVATADPGLKTQAEAAVEINGLPALRLEVQDTADPVEVGGRTSYRIEIINDGTLAGSRVEVVATVPPQVRVLNTTGPGRARMDGNRIVFAPVESLPPGQKVTYMVEVDAVKAGLARFEVELRSQTMREPLTVQESTTVYAVNGPPPAPPTRAEPPVSGPR